MERYNAKVARAPAKPDTLHRALNIEQDRLAEVFRLGDKRHVTKDLTLRYNRKRIRLEVNDPTRGLVGKYVDAYGMPGGRIPGAGERRRPAPRPLRSPPTKVEPVGTKNGNKKIGRRPPGRPSKMEAYHERRRTERAAKADPSRHT